MHYKIECRKKIMTYTDSLKMLTIVLFRNGVNCFTLYLEIKVRFVTVNDFWAI